GARSRALRLTLQCGRGRLPRAGSVPGPPAATQRLLQAERNLSGDPDAPRLLERHWRRVWEIDSLTQSGYDQGRVGLADFADTRGRRLEGETELARPKRRRT